MLHCREQDLTEELKIHSKINGHKNIIKLVEIVLLKQSLRYKIILEFAEAGSMLSTRFWKLYNREYQKIDENRKLCKEFITRFCLGVAEGIDYSKPIILS